MLGKLSSTQRCNIRDLGTGNRWAQRLWGTWPHSSLLGTLQRRPQAGLSGFNPRQGQQSKLALGSIQPPPQWVRGSSPGRETDRVPSFRAEIKNIGTVAPVRQESSLQSHNSTVCGKPSGDIIVSEHNVAFILNRCHTSL